eukprot:12103296-Alexandrium_andersonii.AAC.1
MPGHVPGWNDVFPGVKSNRNNLPGQSSTGSPRHSWSGTARCFSATRRAASPWTGGSTSVPGPTIRMQRRWMTDAFPSGLRPAT